MQRTLQSQSLFPWWVKILGWHATLCFACLFKGLTGWVFTKGYRFSSWRLRSFARHTPPSWRSRIGPVKIKTDDIACPPYGWSKREPLQIAGFVDFSFYHLLRIGFFGCLIWPIAIYSPIVCIEPFRGFDLQPNRDDLWPFCFLSFPTEFLLQRSKIDVGQ